MANTLKDFAEMTSAPIEDVALAIASEFRAVDVAGAHANLDRLAESLGGLGERPPEDRAQGLLEGLTDARGLAATTCACPDSLMLDQVLDLGRGHPLALCIVHVAVARRLGFELHVVGAERVTMVADPGTRPPLLIDPVPGGRRLPQAMSWLCPHVVGATMLGLLSERYERRGSLAEAIRAAELRRIFPLAAENRSRHDTELRSLRARLN